MIHTEEERPLAVSYGYFENKDLCFITKEGIVRFQPASPQDAVLVILKHCTGLNTMSHIQELSGLPFKKFNSITKILYRHEIIFPSRKLGVWLHERGSENSRYHTDFDLKTIESLKGLKRSKHTSDIGSLTPLEKILVRRRSVRSFSGIEISKKELLDFLKDLYFREGVPTVASGGGLYPLQFYVISLHTELPLGLYKYEIDSSKLSLVKKIEDVNKVFFYLQNQPVVEHSSFLVIVCADLNIHAKKYANRGYRYTLMEAGSVVQNAYLKAAESARGVLAYGGFNDSKLKEFLSLGEDVFPLVALIFGGISKEATSTSHLSPYTLQTLINTFAKTNGIIKNYAVSTVAYKKEEILKYCASAAYESSKVTTGKKRSGNGFGTGYSKSDALVKAIAEAVERYYSGEFFFDKKASFRELKQAIRPEDFWILNDKNIPSTKFADFHDDATYAWVRGRHLKKRKSTFILADQIFYPLNKNVLGYQPVYKTNSSGVAADISKDRAGERALLELIERDAIALAWYAGHQIHRIDSSILPSYMQVTCRFWKERGFDVDFYDATVDSVPVILCIFINHSTHPFFVVGGGANYSFEKALEKSIEEAQYAMIAWRAGEKRNVRKEEIQSPLDHGLYYAQAKRADIPFRLLNIAPISSMVRHHKEYSYKDLIRKFDPIEVVLFNSPELSVVRIMSTNLLPLNFGYKLEAINHKRLKQLHLKWRNSEPHFFP